MEKLKRGDKIYLDTENKIESSVNRYLDCRDGSVEVYEYVDVSGYGFPSRLFLCQDHKNESVSIIRQTLINKFWEEGNISFDTDSFEILKALITGDENCPYGKYSLIMD